MTIRPMSTTITTAAAAKSEAFHGTWVGMASYVVTLKCVERNLISVLSFLVMWSKSTGRQNPLLYTRLHTVVQLVHTVVYVHTDVQCVSDGSSTRGTDSHIAVARNTVRNTTVCTTNSQNRIQSHCSQTVFHSFMSPRTFHHCTHVLNITTVWFVCTGEHHDGLHCVQCAN